jgi:hypothetical protein
MCRVDLLVWVLLTEVQRQDITHQVWEAVTQTVALSITTARGAQSGGAGIGAQPRGGVTCAFDVADRGFWAGRLPGTVVTSLPDERIGTSAGIDPGTRGVWKADERGWVWLAEGFCLVEQAGVGLGVMGLI